MLQQRAHGYMPEQTIIMTTLPLLFPTSEIVEGETTGLNNIGASFNEQRGLSVPLTAKRRFANGEAEKENQEAPELGLPRPKLDAADGHSDRSFADERKCDIQAPGQKSRYST